MDTNPDAPPLEVVAAVIVEDGRVLACRRSPLKDSAGLWEFPGGKVEEGESAQASLAREIREELGVDIEVGELLDRSVTVVDGRSIASELLFRAPHRATADLEHRPRPDAVVAHPWSCPTSTGRCPTCRRCASSSPAPSGRMRHGCVGPHPFGHLGGRRWQHELRQAPGRTRPGAGPRGESAAGGAARGRHGGGSHVRLRAVRPVLDVLRCETVHGRAHSGSGRTRHDRPRRSGGDLLAGVRRAREGDDHDPASAAPPIRIRDRGKCGRRRPGDDRLGTHASPHRARAARVACPEPRRRTSS